MPDLPPDVESLSERVARLETLLTDERRLVAGVERLGEQVLGLNALLVRVDEQQATLTRLQQDVVPREELNLRAESSRREFQVYRGRLLRRMYTGLGVLTFFVIFGSIGAIDYLQNQRDESVSYRAEVYAVCEARALQADRVQAYLDGEIDRVGPDRAAETTERLQQLRDAFPKVDCSGLKP